MESKQEEKFVLKQAEEDLKKQQEEQKQERSEKDKHETHKHEEKAKTPEKRETGKKSDKEKQEKPKREIVLERLYSLPMKKLLIGKPRMTRHTTAARRVRAFLAKHFKTGQENVKMDAKIFEKLSRSGRSKLPRDLKVKVSKDKGGSVLAELA